MDGLDASRRVERAQVLVVGAGIAGSAVAASLAAAGFHTALVEPVPALRADGAGIVVHPNGGDVLADLGVDLSTRGRPVARQIVLDRDGWRSELNWTEVWGPGLLPIAVHRPLLAEAIAERLGDVQVRFGTWPVAIGERPGAVEVSFSDGSSGTYDVLVGADGVGSMVRDSVGLVASPRPIGQTYWRTTVPSASVPGSTDWLVWRSGGVHLSVVPLAGGRSHVSIQVPDAVHRQLRHTGHAGLHELAGSLDPTAAAVVRALRFDDEVVTRPALSVRAPHPVRGRVVLVGDAARTVSPATTQGGALALEDAKVLSDEVAAHGPTPAALAAFADRRARRVAEFLRLARLHVQLSEAFGPDTRRRGPDADTARWHRRLYAPLLGPP